MKQALVLAALVFLSACGQKGPLFFAPKPQPEVTAGAGKAEPSSGDEAADKQTQPDTKDQ